MMSSPHDLIEIALLFVLKPQYNTTSSRQSKRKTCNQVDVALAFSQRVPGIGQAKAQEGVVVAKPTKIETSKNVA